jgi:hypothetical protein
MPDNRTLSFVLAPLGYLWPVFAISRLADAAERPIRLGFTRPDSGTAATRPRRPFLLALVDALLAAVIVVLLALSMVISVQMFDALAVQGGGKPLLGLDELFDGICTQPYAPKFWWVYVLLLSTMIPSLINLFIGSTALICGIPGLSQWLLGFLPPDRAVRTYDRAWRRPRRPQRVRPGLRRRGVARRRSPRKGRRPP